MTWSAPADAPEPARALRAEVVADLARQVDLVRTGGAEALAIDMPIGLLDRHPRCCDVEARRRLGPRRSSVFPAPVRAALGAADYDEACRRSQAVSGQALSKQAFHLLPKMAELDRLIEPTDQARVVEAHPELAFARLAGQPLDRSKHTRAGRADRIELLSDALPGFRSLLDDAPGLPLIDLLDAAALAVTARHVAAGCEQRLGHDVDRRGLAARIVY